MGHVYVYRADIGSVQYSSEGSGTAPGDAVEDLGMGLGGLYGVGRHWKFVVQSLGFSSRVTQLPECEQLTDQAIGPRPNEFRARWSRLVPFGAGQGDECNLRPGLAEFSYYFGIVNYPAN